MLWVLGPASGTASGHPQARGGSKVTTVNVTAGKPSELSFKLSKFSNLPAGLITFKVTNMGLGFHNFKICTSPVLTTAKNTCVGKATPLLKHGQSATLVVKLSKNGKYEFLCAVPGHAAAGMKGLIGIGVTVAGGKPTPVATTTPTPTPTPTTTTTASTPPPATTTTTPAGGGGGGGATSPECPPGTTIAQAAAGNGGDADIDDAGGPSDADGCV
jgi:uncharacterized cupredoxin-like copper-binding protein